MNMNVSDSDSYAKICESYTRIVEEQRERAMLRDHIKSQKP